MDNEELLRLLQIADLSLKWEALRPLHDHAMRALHEHARGHAPAPARPQTVPINPVPRPPFNRGGPRDAA